LNQRINDQLSLSDRSQRLVLMPLKKAKITYVAER
jgi:hypothetical protein